MMTPSDQLATPVLLLTFNRPDTTAQVLEAIRDARPEQLLVASDGPRPHITTDADRVAQTRAVIERLVDWPCRIERRYSDTNQGCRVGVASAISWFFEHVEEGIILEDDCVPHPDFFGYCTELLERYRDDRRIMAISGENSIGAVPSDAESSYCFVREPAIWGWATWRASWSQYDANLDNWEVLREDSRALENLWPDRVERAWWITVLNTLRNEGTPDTWDYRWMFTVLYGDGLCCLPRSNLVTNVGFRSDATHTFPRLLGRKHQRDGVLGSSVLPLEHPTAVQRDVRVEGRLFDIAHGGRTLRSPVRRSLNRMKKFVPERLRRLIKTWLQQKRR